MDHCHTYLYFFEYDRLPRHLAAYGAILTDSSLQEHQNDEVQYYQYTPRSQTVPKRKGVLL